VTLKADRVALAAQITTALATLPGVNVLPYDPPTVSGDLVTVSTAGLTATEHQLAVRVYVGAMQSAEGQDLLDDVVDAVEASALSSIPRSDWRMVYDQVKGAFLMTTTVDYPREDWG
jgi:hypothetical protein